MITSWSGRDKTRDKWSLPLEWIEMRTNSHSRIGSKLKKYTYKVYNACVHQFNYHEFEFVVILLFVNAYWSEAGAIVRLCWIRASLKKSSNSSADVFPTESTVQVVIQMTRPLLIACIRKKTLKIPSSNYTILSHASFISLKINTFSELDFAPPPAPFMKAVCAGVGWAKASIAAWIPTCIAETVDGVLLFGSIGGPALANASLI
jgi:hypothetical protein